MLKALMPDGNLHNQLFHLTINPDGVTRAVRVELRFLEHTKKWHLTIWDASDGTCFVRYIPLIVSGEKLNDLLGQFGYLEIGSIACVPIEIENQGKNPGRDNLSGYQILWGDRLFP